jgi:hypothetical protein
MSTVQVDAINESTTNAGVTVDGVLIKDGTVDGVDVSTLSVDTNGLVLVHSSTFSSLNAKSIDNCFSSTYRHYKVNIRSTNSNTSDIHFRFRDGSGDNTDSEYWWKYLYTTSSNNWTAYANGGNTNYAEVISGAGQNMQYNYTLEIYNPQAADFTSFNMHGSWRTGGILINGGGYDEQDQFTGISFYPETGTFSGELQIYGYAK